MATAVREVETKKILDLVEEKEVVLRMTEEEAEFLCSLMQQIGGSPSGYRGIADGFAGALYSAGVTHNEHKYLEHGSIYCKARTA